jgi:3-methylfumaryl-CoA hydratase
MAMVVVGQPLHRHSVVTSVTEKSGRSGKLVFVEVTHELSFEGRLAIVEVQDLVYRGESKAAPSRSADNCTKDVGWTWGYELRPDPTLLFRFSALTYNAHRIHYDRDYATEIERYPGLVVHGPLQAVALAELCRRHVAGHNVASFTFRALGPAFDGAPLQLRGRLQDDENVELAVFSGGGEMTMSASASLRPKGQ